MVNLEFNDAFALKLNSDGPPVTDPALSDALWALIRIQGHRIIKWVEAEQAALESVSEGGGVMAIESVAKMNVQREMHEFVQMMGVYRKLAMSTNGLPMTGGEVESSVLKKRTGLMTAFTQSKAAIA